MHIITKSDLSFQGIQLQPVANIDGTWLTASQIGYALQYADDKAVQRIYSRHADEFTEKMTGVVKVTTPYGDQMTRAFSLRGAHLIAMFARTPKAKEFRRWVLDILDQEVVADNVNSTFNFEMAAHSAHAINAHLKAIKEMWRGGLEEGLKLMEYKNTGNISERLADITFHTVPLENQILQYSRKRIH